MGNFPFWIRHGGKLESNLNYVGGRLEVKVIQSEVGYQRFMELVGSFF